MTIINTQVAANLDDVHELSGTVIDGANYVSYGLVGNAYYAGLRWTAAIPQLYTINTAYIRIYVYDASYDDANIRIFFEKVADPAQFVTGGGSDVSSRTKTTASVDWVQSGLASGGAAWCNSPSLVTPLQELVNAFTTVHIAVITQQIGSNNLYGRPYNYAVWAGAYLYVDYSGGGPTPGSAGVGGSAASKLIASRMI